MVKSYLFLGKVQEKPKRWPVYPRVSPLSSATAADIEGLEVTLWCQVDPLMLSAWLTILYDFQKITINRKQNPSNCIENWEMLTSKLPAKYHDIF